MYIKSLLPSEYNDRIQYRTHVLVDHVQDAYQIPDVFKHNGYTVKNIYGTPMPKPRSDICRRAVPATISPCLSEVRVWESVDDKILQIEVIATAEMATRWTQSLTGVFPITPVMMQTEVSEYDNPIGEVVGHRWVRTDAHRLRPGDIIQGMDSSTGATIPTPILHIVRGSASEMVTVTIDSSGATPGDISITVSGDCLLHTSRGMVAASEVEPSVDVITCYDDSLHGSSEGVVKAVHTTTATEAVKIITATPVIILCHVPVFTIDAYVPSTLDVSQAGDGLTAIEAVMRAARSTDLQTLARDQQVVDTVLAPLVSAIDDRWYLDAKQAVNGILEHMRLLISEYNDESLASSVENIFDVLLSHMESSCAVHSASSRLETPGRSDVLPAESLPTNEDLAAVAVYNLASGETEGMSLGFKHAVVESVVDITYFASGVMHHIICSPNTKILCLRQDRREWVQVTMLRSRERLVYGSGTCTVLRRREVHTMTKCTSISRSAVGILYGVWCNGIVIK